MDKEATSGQMKDYKIFMAMIDRIGHDKRGTPLFKRDKYGNEILVPEEVETTSINSKTQETEVVKTTAQIKIIDDQTKDIPQIFAKWKQQEGIGW